MQILNTDRSGNGSIPCSSSCRERPWAIPTVDQFKDLTESLGRRATGRKRALLHMLDSMPALIWELDPHFRLYGRIKSLESISNKMVGNNLDASQILDIIGVRAITKDQSDCYRLIRRVHSEFQVLAGEYDDYIAAPKPNGYRSIHTTVVSPCGFPVEIQARTHAMHEICERGSAAHSVYKRNRVAWMSLFPGSPRLGGVA
jgi:(p)ppGpp synthase/HD superfamily hydrolase